MRNSDDYYKGYRFPKSVIGYTLWLYFRFTLSLRDVSEILLERGIALTYETIREWAAKLGHCYAKDIKRRAPRRGDKWHLDEVCLIINKKKYWLWRAVDRMRSKNYILDKLSSFSFF